MTKRERVDAASEFAERVVYDPQAMRDRAILGVSFHDGETGERIDPNGLALPSAVLPGGAPAPSHALRWEPPRWVPIADAPPRGPNRHDRRRMAAEARRRP